MRAEEKPRLAGAGAAASETSCKTDYTDLFPETVPPVMPARWPRPGSRAADALNALMQGPVNQADYLASWRLAASVKQLEYDGWGIIRREAVASGCRGPIAEYRLDRCNPSVMAALASREVRP